MADNPDLRSVKGSVLMVSTFFYVVAIPLLQQIASQISPHYSSKNTIYIHIVKKYQLFCESKKTRFGQIEYSIYN